MPETTAQAAFPSVYPGASVASACRIENQMRGALCASSSFMPTRNRRASTAR